MSADIAANEIYKLRNEIARLKGQTNWVCSCGGTDCKGQQENADLRDTLDAVIAADGRAVDLWRAAHPGKALVIPDRANLVGWLLEENAAQQAAIIEFRDACWDAFSIPVPNVKPYYALVAKHAARLPRLKSKEAQP